VPSICSCIQKLVDENPRIKDWGSLILKNYPRKVFLKDWVQKGYHAGLTYMQNNLEVRMDPQRFQTWGKSVLLFSLDYPVPLPVGERKGLKIASYARGEDYHFECKEILKKLERELKKTMTIDNFNFFGFVDSSPVFERDLAVEMGIGWSGKNCCTLNRTNGSAFFLFGCIVDFELEQKKASPDSCGTCDRCLVECPTGAFIAPGVIDSAKCISYWTIEHKGEIPEEMARQLDGWIFGCDVCQDVCPWNSKQKGELPEDDFEMDSLAWLSLLRKGGGFKSRFKGTPLQRAGRKMMLRNVIIAVRNSCEHSAIPLLKELKKEEDRLIQNEIDKTLKKFSHSEK